MTTLHASVDWSFADQLAPTTANMHGLARQVLVGAAHGATHSELGVTVIQPGGSIRDEHLDAVAGATI